MNKYSQKTATLIAIAIFSFSLIACSGIRHAYKGEKLPNERLAFVVGSDKVNVGRKEGMYIFGVDGEEFDHFAEYPYGVYLLPGTHRLSVEYFNQYYSVATLAYQEHEVTVEAGKTYRLKSEISNPKVGGNDYIKIWIENDQGQSIGKRVQNTLHPTSAGWVKMN